MGLRVYEVTDADGSRQGVVLVDSVTGIPLPMELVQDDDERGVGAWELAEGFVAWSEEIDGRDPRGVTLGVLGSMWRRYLARRHDTIVGESV